jgi:hypothetical protein
MICSCNLGVFFQQQDLHKASQEFLPRILDFKILWVEHLVQGHIPSLRTSV